MRRIFTRTCVYLSLLLLLAGCFHIQLTGSVAGATVTITLLRGGGDPIVFGPSVDEDYWIGIMGEEAWQDLPEAVRLAFSGMAFLPGDPGLDPDAFYLVEANGGEDLDPDRQSDLQGEPASVAGKWHALAKGSRILKGNLKVSIATEAIYQYLKADIPNMTDMELMNKLDEVTVMFLRDADMSGSVDYDDALRWNSTFDALLYVGQTATLDELANAVRAGETSDAVLLSNATAIIENRFGLSGVWSGRSVDGAGGVNNPYGISIVDNQITSISSNNILTGVTGSLISKAVGGFPGTNYDVTFSDGRNGHLMMLDSGRHAVLVDNNLLFSVLELAAGPRPTYAEGDLVGNYDGGAIATLLYPLLLGGAAQLSCDNATGQVDCTGLANLGIASGIVDSQDNGVFQVTAFDDDGDPQNNAWLVLSNDRALLGILYCDKTYAAGITDPDCGFGPFMRKP
jgi:hypothetical protein